MKDTRKMSLVEIEDEICRKYQWFARNAPGVTPKEVDRLEQLWRQADRLYREEEG